MDVYDCSLALNLCITVYSGLLFTRHYLVIPVEHIPTVKHLQRRTEDYHLGMQFRLYRPSAVNFGCRWSIEGEIDRRRSIEGEKGKKKRKRKRRKKKKKRRRRKKNASFSRVILARMSSSPAGDSSPACGDGTSPRGGRKIEAASPW
ncbi:hypothetical protein GW17_00034411 [Ensete ventricosum]|nr:hypothetical protein GW17_00034411 [Ensete ventricosum]